MHLSDIRIAWSKMYLKIDELISLGAKPEKIREIIIKFAAKTDDFIEKSLIEIAKKESQLGRTLTKDEVSEITNLLKNTLNYKMEKPKIYTLNCNHNIGMVGPGSFMVQQPVCPKCNRTLIKEIKYSELELKFDCYNGEDMFSSMGCIIVTKQLFDKLEEEGVKGYTPIKVKNKKSKYFTGNYKDIGLFLYLAIFPPAVKNIPIAYEFEGICDECGLMMVDFDTLNMDLMLRESSENQTPLKVYSDSWNGNDIFNFLDHSEIGVTQKFLDVIKDFNCPDNIIVPAEWI